MVGKKGLFFFCSCPGVNLYIAPVSICGTDMVFILLFIVAGILTVSRPSENIINRCP